MDSWYWDELFVKEEEIVVRCLVSMIMALVMLLTFLPTLLLSVPAGVLAGLLLAVSDIILLLILDICSFFLTVITTGIVKRGLTAKAAEVRESFVASFHEGWKAVTQKRGVIILIRVSSVLACFMGAFQILAEPLLLDFTSSAPPSAVPVKNQRIGSSLV